MKRLGILFSFALLLAACETQPANPTANNSTGQVEFVSTKTEGKWSVDRATAEELKGMKNTVENFTLLNKRKFENLPAYQEYGLLLSNHINRVTTYCQLDSKSKNALCAQLNTIKEQIEILQGGDMEKSRQAVIEVNKIFVEIDSSFNYNN